MTLFIEQKLFSFKDKFFVKDENGQDRYYVEGELISLGKKLHVYDMSGKELALIEQKLLTLMPKFNVYINGQHSAEIVKEISLFRPRYTIRARGSTWDSEGVYLLHEYRISCQGQPILEICKDWRTWGDCYRLDIVHPDDELIALALVLAIDCVIDQSSD